MSMLKPFGPRSRVSLAAASTMRARVARTNSRRVGLIQFSDTQPGIPAPAAVIFAPARRKRSDFASRSINPQVHMGLVGRNARGLFRGALNLLARRAAQASAMDRSPATKRLTTV